MEIREALQKHFPFFWGNFLSQRGFWGIFLKFVFRKCFLYFRMSFLKHFFSSFFPDFFQKFISGRFATSRPPIAPFFPGIRGGGGALNMTEKKDGLGVF